jgi:hypothetical protein
MATALASAWALPAAAHLAAAPSLSPLASTLQPDELAFEWCDLLREAEAFCAPIEPAHRAHGLHCWLANPSLPCDRHQSDAAARCCRVAGMYAAAPWAASAPHARRRRARDTTTGELEPYQMRTLLITR